MIKGLDHIGVAVKSIDGPMALYANLLGLNVQAVEEVAAMGVKVAKLSIPANEAVLEFVEPTSPTSAIAKFLEKKGEGIHHVCFRVERIEEVLERLKREGVPLVDEKPRIGAGGHKVAFLHPKGCAGVLIELSE